MVEQVKTHVAGDVVVDVQIYEGQGRDKRTQLRDGTLHTMTGGGARLLFDLLLACQNEYPRALDRVHRLAVERAEAEARRKSKPIDEALRQAARESVNPTFLPLLLAEGKRQPRLFTGAAHELAASRACGLYRPYPACADSTYNDADEERVWRLHEALGYGPRTEPAKLGPVLADDATANDSVVWVLDDAGLGFRHREAKAAWPPLLRGEPGAAPAWLILKAAAPVAAGDLWHSIVTQLGEDNEPLTERMIAVVSADDLRASGVPLSRSGSWERAALEVAKAAPSNPTMSALLKCRHVAILFGAEGALYCDFRRAEAPAYHLIVHAAHVEGEWLAEVPGDTLGKLSCFTAGIVTHLPTILGSDGDEGRLELASILDGIRAGLAGVRTLMSVGHGRVARDVRPQFPSMEVAREVLDPTSTWQHIPVPEIDDKITPALSGNRVWRIIEGNAERDPGRVDRLLGAARLVAQFGINTLAQVPYFRLGALQTVDRDEIESLRNIKSLITSYQRLERPKRPLSIGVFGQPGSGKSFGVREIARAVLGPKTPILEFNLSQLGDQNESELIGAFHQIRDRVLEGHTPLVLWDEFDAGGLQWLARLLAPMQDGTFMEGQRRHPIGKSVFVFAGGTAYDFDSFGPPLFADETIEELSDGKRARYEVELREFRERKGPDFKSRLTAYLNVTGPNPRRFRNWERGVYEVDRTDTGYPLRRALLLRSQFGLGPREVLDIEPALLTALLQTETYHHGARSMEKLVERIVANRRGSRVRVAHLPAERELELYVNARNFRQLLERDLTFQRMAEKIAPFIHANYLTDAIQAGRMVAADAKREFDALPYELQQDNVAAARRIPEVLALAGLELADNSVSPPRPDFNEEASRRRIDERLEMLAEAEHNGWMESKLQNDWKYDRVRDDSKKQHDCLVPYRSLTEDQKATDRDQVRHFPEYVAAANFRVQFAPR